MTHFDVPLNGSVVVNGVTFTSFCHAYTPSAATGLGPLTEKYLIVYYNGIFIGMMTPRDEGTSVLISNELGPEQIIASFTTLEEAADLIVKEVLIHNL